jgi:hypothetical protein
MNEYRQNDMGICAFLMTKGFKVLGLAPARRGFDFRFADDGTAEQAAIQYLQGEPAPARAFYDALKTMKTMLYRIKNSGHAPTGDEYHAGCTSR